MILSARQLMKTFKEPPLSWGIHAGEGNGNYQANQAEPRATVCRRTGSRNPLGPIFHSPNTIVLGQTHLTQSYVERGVSALTGFGYHYTLVLGQNKTT